MYIGLHVGVVRSFDR